MRIRLTQTKAIYDVNDKKLYIIETKGGFFSSWVRFKDIYATCFKEAERMARLEIKRNNRKVITQELLPILDDGKFALR